LCQLTSIILKIDAPLPAADVRKPARSEWPENALASNPARSAYALTILATDRSVSRESFSSCYAPGNHGVRSSARSRPCAGSNRRTAGRSRGRLLRVPARPGRSKRRRCEAEAAEPMKGGRQIAGIVNTVSVSSESSGTTTSDGWGDKPAGNGRGSSLGLKPLESSQRAGDCSGQQTGSHRLERPGPRPRGSSRHIRLTALDRCHFSCRGLRECETRWRFGIHGAREPR
jgi:hypothetical protein